MKRYVTFREWADKYLVDNGFMPLDAVKVVDACIADPANKAMDRWRDCVDDYPVSMRAAIVLMLNRAALVWIDANCPLAWYRPMFDGTAAKIVAEQKAEKGSSS